MWRNLWEIAITFTVLPRLASRRPQFSSIHSKRSVGFVPSGTLLVFLLFRKGCLSLCSLLRFLQFQNRIVHIGTAHDSVTLEHAPGTPAADFHPLKIRSSQWGHLTGEIRKICRHILPVCISGYRGRDCVNRVNAIESVVLAGMVQLYATAYNFSVAIHRRCQQPRIIICFKILADAQRTEGMRTARSEEQGNAMPKLYSTPVVWIRRVSNAPASIYALFKIIQAAFFS